MEKYHPDPLADLERQNLGARQQHQRELMAEVGRCTDRWADRAGQRRRYGSAAAVLVFLFFFTQPVMARQLPDIPVRTSSFAGQQHAVQVAHELIVAR